MKYDIIDFAARYNPETSELQSYILDSNGNVRYTKNGKWEIWVHGQYVDKNPQGEPFKMDIILEKSHNLLEAFMMDTHGVSYHGIFDKTSGKVIWKKI